MLTSIDYYIKSLNNSKYFAGIMILILNIGSRFIQIRLSDSAEKYIKYSLIRELLIFPSLFSSISFVIFFNLSGNKQ